MPQSCLCPLVTEHAIEENIGDILLANAQLEESNVYSNIIHVCTKYMKLVCLILQIYIGK